MAESIPVMKTITGAKDPTGSFIAINHLHSETHKGNAYKSYYFSSTLVDSTTINLQINGFTGYEAHLKHFAVTTNTGKATVTFKKASSTMTTGNTAVTINNKNQTSTNVNVVKIFSNPTNISSTTTILEQFFVGSSLASNQTPSQGGVGAFSDEWVVGNSTYIISISIASTGVCTAAGNLIWYEEEA